jgi:hypothetical protein
MTSNHDRTQAVAEFGLAERQARFLVLVIRHAGVCVPRQYARFAGVAYGAKCNAFFDKLVRRGFARASECIHNRARLYHVHHKPLYHIIRVSPRLAIERLMLLDAVLATPDLEWLTTAPEKAAYLCQAESIGRRRDRTGGALRCRLETFFRSSKRVRDRGGGGRAHGHPLLGGGGVDGCLP